MPMESNAETMSAKRLRLGLLLAWTPLMFFIVPTAIGIIGAIAQMSTQNATGLGAVAGGFTEVVATFGLVVIVASEVAAIVMLLRTLSRSHPVRTTVAVISICCSGLLLLALGLFLMGHARASVAINRHYTNNAVVSANACLRQLPSGRGNRCSAFFTKLGQRRDMVAI